MNKVSASPASAPERDPDEIAPEYDFRGARPTPYAARYAAGAQAVVLDPDVAAAFPDAAAVNGALRGLLELARRQARLAGQAPAAEARLT